MLIDIDKFTLDKQIYNNVLLYPHLFGLRIMGYALFTDQKLRQLHCIRGAFLTFSFLIFNLTQYKDLISLWGDVDEMTINAATTLLFTTTAFRMVNFYRNRSRYTQIIRDVDYELTEIIANGNACETKLITKRIRYSKRLTILFTASALLTGNLMCINSFIQLYLYQPTSIVDEMGMNKTSFPPVILRSWFPFDDAWNNYYSMYFVQFTIMWIGMIIVPCWHCFIVALMIFAIIKLDLLDYKLRNLKEYTKQHLKRTQHKRTNDTKQFYHPHSKMVGDIQYNILIQCIGSYTNIGIFVKKLENLISGSIFLDFIVFSILLCALLFQASKNDGFGINFTITFFYILTMITILWMYYWHANYISLKSNDLSLSVYNSNWYELARYKKIKSAMLIFMGARVIKMKAGFIAMTLDTLITILRAAYSYFTLLKQMEK